MAHEVAHVNKRHLAHRQQDRQLPSLLTQAALIAASVASQNAAPLITGMAINVAVDLHYSRADESESDRLGAIWASKAGFDPADGARFFERILEQRDSDPTSIPPYLFSHPAVDERIALFRERATTLRPLRRPRPGTVDRFQQMQARLAQLLDEGRIELPGGGASIDPARNDAALAKVDALEAAGESSQALLALTELTLRAPDDPRVAFRMGRALHDAGRLDGAIAAYRRTLELDIGRAQVYYQLGLAYRDRGDRVRAVFALEQAGKRGAGDLLARARWEITKLDFGVIAEAGLADGRLGGAGATPAGAPVEVVYGDGDGTALHWWGRVSGPVLSRKNDITLRLSGPDGALGDEFTPEPSGRLHLTARIEIPVGGIGRFTVETRIDGHTARRDSIEVLPATTTTE